MSDELKKTLAEREEKIKQLQAELDKHNDLVNDVIKSMALELSGQVVRELEEKLIDKFSDKIETMFAGESNELRATIDYQNLVIKKTTETNLFRIFPIGFWSIHKAMKQINKEYEDVKKTNEQRAGSRTASK